MQTFREYLFEQPMIVQKMVWRELDDPKLRKNFINHLTYGDGEIVGYHNGLELRDVRVSQMRIIYAMKNDEPVYCLWYGEIATSVMQIRVWRNKKVKETEGLPSKVVFDVLLKKYDNILTDQEQTPDGMKFWKKLFRYASKSSIYKLGFVKVSDKGTKIYWDPKEETIDSWLDKNQNIIWGNSKIHSKTLGFIEKR